MNLISGAKRTLLLRLKEHCCLPYSSLCRLHFSYKNCSVMQWAVWLTSRLEPAREPITSRAEPLLWAREIAEPSQARLAARPSRSEPSRAWLGSFPALLRPIYIEEKGKERMIECRSFLPGRDIPVEANIDCTAAAAAPNRVTNLPISTTSKCAPPLKLSGCPWHLSPNRTLPVK